MMVIGLTGGIGSGKSTVATMLLNANIPVIDADKLARELTEKSSEANKEIAQKFGEVFFADGSLNRAKLAAQVFSDPKKLLELENILHPKIEDLRKSRLAKLEKEGYKVAIYMAPLIFEKGLEKNLDQVILVVADGNIKLSRITKRDNLSHEEAKRRINAQMRDEEKRSKAHVVIENNGSLSELYQKLSLAFKEISGIDLPPKQY